MSRRPEPDLSRLRLPASSRVIPAAAGGQEELVVLVVLHWDPAAVWDFLIGPVGLACWLGNGVRLPPASPDQGAGDSDWEPYETADGYTGEIRINHLGHYVELTLDATHVVISVGLSAAGRGPRLTVIRVRQRSRPDRADRERRQARWEAALDRMARLIVTR
ncbi:hypothetical protein ACWEFL_09460 [Streptomyces sp. NPDC004838]